MLEPAPTSDPVAGGIEESYRLLMECVTDYALVLLDGEGRVAVWNAGAEGVLGYQAAEIVGGTAQEFDAFIKSELKRWPEVVRVAGIKPQ